MRNLLLVFGIVFCIISCTSKEDSASDSLIGEWSIVSFYKSTTLPTGTEDYQEDGNGTFTFSAETVDYAYILEGESWNKAFDYTLELSKENAGFTSVKRFDIVGDEMYRVRFGDETSDAHCEATMMTLETTGMTNANEYTLLITLEKQ